MAPMRKLWNLLSSLSAMAILATVVVAVPQTPLNAQKGGAKGGGDGAAPSSSQAAGLRSGKNLTVLTPENVDITMQNITLALGVNCTFCHEANLPADTKPEKLKARMMLEMVRDINAKFGDGKTHVTCWTCHHASTEPQIAKPSVN